MFYLKNNLFLILIINEVINCARIQQQYYRELAQMHKNFMEKEGKCLEPKPVIIYPPIGGHKVFYPKATVNSTIF
jgi:hypothetical protein